MALVRYFGDPPDTSITAGPAASTTATDASFSFAASAPGATFECRLDGAAWSACSSAQGYSGLSVGSHTFDVRATYPVGNTDPTPASYSWSVTAPPPSDPPPATDPPASTPIPTPKPKPPPGNASIKAGDVTVGSDGVAPFVVTCGPTADCKGTVLLEMGTVTQTGRKASISRRSRPRVVGRAKFSVKRGGKLTVKVRLAGSAKRMLRDKGSVSATLKVTTVSAGKQLTTSKKIKIVAKAARRSRPRRVRR
jgi:hypothetical protein